MKKKYLCISFHFNPDLEQLLTKTIHVKWADNVKGLSVCMQLPVLDIYSNVTLTIPYDDP